MFRGEVGLCKAAGVAELDDNITSVLEKKRRITAVTTNLTAG
jgi:hypothetical protein